jgi:hypothetical protein
MTNVDKIIAAAAALKGMLTNFMPTSQRLALITQLAGEEANGAADLVLNIVERIKACPLTYQTDGQGMNAVAHLHYFAGNFDAWISERDAGEDRTRPLAGFGVQRQAFGLASFGHECDFGYIGIAEIIHHEVELDLHWEPKQLKDCKKS